MHIEEIALESLLNAIQTQQPVEGLTHNFYRYPARFSPVMARAAIETFSNVGDLVLDPFVGGGTSLVEARALGRRAIGLDVSDLSIFVTRVKSTPLSKTDTSAIRDWAKGVGNELTVRNQRTGSERAEEVIYKRNLTGGTWPIRRVTELALDRLQVLDGVRRQNFVRCALLKTAQWALDCRKDIPSAVEFRRRFFLNIEQMCKQAETFSSVAHKAARTHPTGARFRTRCLRRSAVGVEDDTQVTECGPPRLVLTSPPYPGVHLLYHRWQIHGRRETPAPFWIAGCTDGSGAAFYTMGDRKQLGLNGYYDAIYRAFKSIASISDSETVLVQVVAFSEPFWQLPRYLETLQLAGFRELEVNGMKGVVDARQWRRVPNRKWYATQKGEISSSKEVVLFHCLK